MYDVSAEAEKLKESKNFNIFFWASIKIIIASILIYYFEFGIYIVIGYILFFIVNDSYYSLLNVKEGNVQFNKLYNKKASIEDCENLQKQIDDLKRQISKKD